MIKSFIKSISQTLGILPYLIYIQKRYFPNEHDKKQAAFEERYFNFYSKFIKSGDLCFDVGAHMGNRVSVLKKCGANVVALEPYKPCYDYMKVKFGPSVTILNKGVGPRKEVRKLYVSDDPTTNSFSDDWVRNVSTNRFMGRKWRKQVETQMTSLDDLISEYGTPIFCKIDVEGFEYDVLKGLSKPIDIISFEYTVPEDISSVFKCMEKLNSIHSGYRYNYSVGETMVLSLPEFISFDQFCEYIKSQDFIESSCGDVYATIVHDLKI